MWEDFYLADKREREYARKKDQPLDKPTIVFRKITQIPPRYHFGACLYEDEIIVYGGQTAQQDVCKSVRINISSRQTKELINAVKEEEFFDLHYVNLPVLESSKTPLEKSGVSDAALKSTSTQTITSTPGPSHQHTSHISYENFEYSNSRTEAPKRKHPSDPAKSTCGKRLAIQSSFVNSSFPKTTPHTMMKQTTLTLGSSSLKHERTLRDLNSAV